MRPGYEPYESSSIEDLLAACLSGADPGAWDAFVARIQPLIAALACRAARRCSGDSDLAEELVQEVFAKLVAGRLLHRFEPRYPGSVFAYIKVVALNVIQDCLKARSAEKRGGDLRAIDFADAEAEAAGRAQLPAPGDAILFDQIEECARRAASDLPLNRDLLIFQLYYRLGLSAEAIASIPCLELSLKGVESLLHRLTRAVRSLILDRRDPIQERAKAADVVL